MKYLVSVQIFVLFFIVSQLKAQDRPQYAVSLIPDSLKKNASAVVREDIEAFEVNAINDATFKFRNVITVLKENNPFDVFQVYYDKTSKVKTIRARYYDAEGKLIRKVEKDEISDRPYNSSALYTDSRLKTIENNYGILPYTFELEYEIKETSFFQFPSWSPQNYKVSVQHSEYFISEPQEFKLNFHILNTDLKPSTSLKDSKRTYLWQMDNVKAVSKEVYAPAYFKTLTTVQTTSSPFSYFDFKGEINTWESFGKFVAELNRDRDKFSAPMELRIKSMVENCKTNREKIDTLYHYLQHSTRYVLITLGIGGLQSYDAAYVEKNKYGDCKALSNFMKSMLKVVGIEAQLVVVYGGESNFFDPDPKFCFNGFNHMILYIPSEKMWLECTADDLPTGYLSTFTQGRGVLVLTDSSGKLMRTPALDSTTNVENTKSVIQLATDGSATLKNYSVLKGSLQDVLRSLVKNFSKEDIQKRFQQHNKLPAFKIDKLEDIVDANQPEVKRNYDLSFEKFGAKAGTRLIIPINADNAFDDTPPPTEQRNFPIEAGGSGYTQNVETTLIIPEGFTIEALPAEKTEMHSVYGSYVSSVEKTEKSVIFKRKLVIKPVSQPAEKFNEFRDFYKKMEQADAAKVILKSVVR